MIEKYLRPDGPKWFSSEGPEKDIVFGTRVIFFRNFRDYIFPAKAPAKHLKITDSKIASQLAELYDIDRIKISSLTAKEKRLLSEHLILSPYVPTHDYSHICFYPDFQRIALTNTTDHFVLISYGSGFQPYSVFEISHNQIVEMDKENIFAHSDKWGYLTSTPYTIGCAFNVSFYLNLWGLANMGNLEDIQNKIKNAVAIRSFFTHGNEIVGYLFKMLSTQTFGYTQEQVIRNTKLAMRGLIDAEKKARDTLKEKASILIEDKSLRALSILKSARVLNYHETLSMLSAVKTGIDCGIITGDITEIYKMIILIHPNNLLTYYSDGVQEEFVDALRAEVVRNRIVNFDTLH